MDRSVLSFQTSLHQTAFCLLHESLVLLLVDCTKITVILLLWGLPNMGGTILKTVLATLALLDSALAQGCVVSELESGGHGISIGCPATAPAASDQGSAGSQTTVSTHGIVLTVPTGVTTLTTITRSGSNVLTYTPLAVTTAASIEDWEGDHYHYWWQHDHEHNLGQS